MPVNLCHACGRANADDAAHCDACGVFLDEVDTEWLTLDNRGPASGLWLGGRIEPPRQAPASATPAQADAEPSITLRDVGAKRPAGTIWTSQIPLPVVLEELVVSDHELRPAVIAPMDDLPAPPPVSDAVRHRTKAERRAAVRRLRRRGTRSENAEPAVSEVLVYDADDGERDRLSSLLRTFGFGVHAVGHVDKAAALVASRHFVAAFVDVALDASDGGAGIDLCKQLRADSRRHDGTDTLLVLTRAALQPIDRARANLAGCDETIAKPVTRGSVAGALDNRGIALPVDPRGD